MKITTVFKSLTLSIAISSLTACSHVEKNKNTIVIQDQSASNIILNLGNLDAKKSYENIDNDLQSFLEGYQNVNVGEVKKAQAIFETLTQSKNKEAQEYGEYGLLLITNEVENLAQMLQSIKRIDSLENKSEWLKLEVRNYKILYNSMMTNFDVADDMLSRIKESEISNSSLLSGLKVGSFIRSNELKNAEKVLDNLSQESEISIDWRAYLLSITKGQDQVIKFLLSKMDEYPDSEHLKLLYNRYLVNTDKEEATNRAYQLGLNTNSTYITFYSIEILMIGGDLTDQKTLDMISPLLNKVLYELDSAENYIEYYLLNIAIPDSEESSYNNIIIANKFNPMNYLLLLNQYYMAPEDEQLDFLKKIEKLDPYSNNTLVMLADFYSYNNMVQELKEVKQKFNNSIRFKTKEEMDFFDSI